MLSILLGLLNTLITVLIFAIIGRVMLSWLLRAGTSNDIVLRIDYVLGLISDPLMRPLRRLIPPLGTIDLAPMAAIILLFVVQSFIRGN
jgi:YggT family protein